MTCTVVFRQRSARGDGEPNGSSRHNRSEPRMTMPPLLSALAGFVSAGLRPRTPLAKTIVVALAIKLCVVAAMRIFLFGGDARPEIDSDAARHLLFGPAVAASERSTIHD